MFFLDKKAFFVLILASIAFVALSGCIQPPVCGNGVCETGEDSINCPQDCGPATGDLEATVVDKETQQPIEGAEVTALASDGSGVGGSTNSSGYILFASLNPETYSVTASKDGYESTTIDGVVVRSNETTSITLELEPSAVQFDEIAVGNNVVKYTDNARIEREVPFYISLDNSSTEATFTLDDQTFYYRCSTTDVNMRIYNENYLNGEKISLRDNNAANVEMLTDNGWRMVGGSGAEPFIDFKGVQYGIGGTTNSPLTVWVVADGNCEFSTQVFSNADYLDLDGAENYTVREGSFTTKTVYYDDDNAMRTPLDLPLYVTNDTMNDTYKYRMYVERASASDGDIYLLLDRDTDFTNEFSDTDIEFFGTDTVEDSIADMRYYWLDTPDFGNTAGDNAYLTAQLFVKEDGVRDSVVALIDTATDDLIALPNDQLGFYEGCVYFIGEQGTEKVLCRSDLPCPPNYCFNATTAYGSEIDATGGIAKISVPVGGGGGGGGHKAINWG